MLGRNDKKQNQKGSLLIEAMAMLGLIAMVTPMLYRKAAERTNELQDINAASQMRVLSSAVDTYLRDNYDKIVTNEKITTDCGDAADKQYSFSGDDSNEVIPLGHLCEYLPYGFNDNSMMFSDIKIGVKRRNFTSASGGSVIRQGLSALILATPTSGANMPRVRASRIASMIGTNGGLVDNKVGYGVQGVWQINLEDFDATDFEPSNAINNSVLATSMESIASGNRGREDVLHRNKVDEEGVMNTMNTTLHMGSHAIDDIQQLIVNGSGLDTPDEAILLEDGTGIEIESGNLHVGGNTTLDGTLDVGGAADFGSDVTVAGLLKALQVEVTEWLKAGSAEILGQLSAAGGKFMVDVDGNTTIGGTLDVAGDTTLQSNLSVEGTSDLKGKVTIGTSAGATGDPDDNVVLEVKGDAHFEEDIYVAGVADVDYLNVRKVFQAGLGDDGVYNMQVTKDKVDILANNFMVGYPTNPDQATGFMITEELTRMKNGTRIELESPEILLGNSSNPSMLTVVDNDGVAVNEENFLVRDADNTLFEVNQSSKEVRVKGGADFIVRSKGATDGGGNITGDDLIFQVDQDGVYQTAERGASVYVRKGVMELGRNDASDPTDKSAYTGYIKLDRIVANEPVDENAFHAVDNNNGYGGIVQYDEFQVNPAYTSVMHDIKLTTRGGARLSDILPDFINKGIYVLDGTYKEKLGGKSVNWDTDSDGKPVAKSNFPYDDSTLQSTGNIVIMAEDCTEGDLTCPATPWLGFIPAPTCPPGYMKVATLNPIRWAMAQAGRPVKSVRSGADADEVQLVYNRNPNQVKYGSDGVAEPWKLALTFQQSTWLSTSLKAFTSGGVSYGWSGIIGFIYPAVDYAQYINAIGELTYADINNSTIVWNLFEVYNQQIVGIANVYCYFERRSSNSDFKNDTLIDRYDQLSKIRVHYNEKEDAYLKRLNDPKLKYTDPW